MPRGICMGDEHTCHLHSTSLSSIISSSCRTRLASSKSSSDFCLSAKSNRPRAMTRHARQSRTYPSFSAPPSPCPPFPAHPPVAPHRSCQVCLAVGTSVNSNVRSNRLLPGRALKTGKFKRFLFDLRIQTLTQLSPGYVCRHSPPKWIDGSTIFVIYRPIVPRRELYGRENLALRERIGF